MKPTEPHWSFVVLALLGVWMFACPATLGYTGAMMHSDLLSGALLLCFGLASVLTRQRWWARWAAAIVAFWLLFAPLVVQTPSAAAYLNSTVVGTLGVAMAFVVPRGLNGPRSDSPDTPPGWSYNPSS